MAVSTSRTTGGYIGSGSGGAIPSGWTEFGDAYWQQSTPNKPIAQYYKIAVGNDSLPTMGTYASSGSSTPVSVTYVTAIELKDTTAGTNAGAHWDVSNRQGLGIAYNQAATPYSVAAFNSYSGTGTTNTLTISGATPSPFTDSALWIVGRTNQNYSSATWPLGATPSVGTNGSTISGSLLWQGVYNYNSATPSPQFGITTGSGGVTTQSAYMLGFNLATSHQATPQPASARVSYVGVNSITAGAQIGGLPKSTPQTANSRISVIESVSQKAGSKVSAPLSNSITASAKIKPSAWNYSTLYLSVGNSPKQVLGNNYFNLSSDVDGGYPGLITRLTSSLSPSSTPISSISVVLPSAYSSSAYGQATPNVYYNKYQATPNTKIIPLNIPSGSFVVISNYSGNTLLTKQIFKTSSAITPPLPTSTPPPLTISIVPTSVSYTFSTSAIVSIVPNYTFIIDGGQSI